MYIIAAIGVGLIVLSRKRNKLLKKFNEYSKILSMDSTGSIENLANTISTSQDIVKENFKKMINSNYFGNAYIDEKVNRIILPQYNNENVTVKCNNCGGINKVIKGKICACDFCGSPLNKD